MKKSFVYLICVLLMAAMLCGCGASNTDSGMVSSSPSRLFHGTATVMPTTSPMASADAGTGSQTSSPSVSGSAGNSSGSAAESGMPEQQCRRIIAQI